MPLVHKCSNKTCRQCWKVTTKGENIHKKPGDPSVQETTCDANVGTEGQAAETFQKEAASFKADGICMLKVS